MPKREWAPDVIVSEWLPMSRDSVDRVLNAELSADLVHRARVRHGLGMSESGAFDESLIDTTMHFGNLVAKSLAEFVVSVVALGFAVDLHSESGRSVHA